AGGLEGERGELADPRGDVVGEVRRAAEVDVGGVDVLGLEVVEVVAGEGDLAGQGGPRRLVAAALEDRALDLASFERGLDDDLRVVPLRLGDGGGEVLAAVDLADPERGAGAGGLDEHRVAERVDGVNRGVG